MKPRTAAVSVAMLATVLGLAGCDRSSSPNTPAQVTVTSTITQSAPGNPAPSTGEEAQTPGAGGANPADYQGTGGYYFVSPSGKWHCAILTDTRQAGCNGTMPPMAPNVPGAGAPDAMVRPNAIVVGAGPGMAQFMSFGGADLQMLGPNTKPLPYGQTLTVGDFRCSVDTDTGVTCDNTLSHHGFTISDHTFDLR